MGCFFASFVFNLSDDRLFFSAQKVKENEESVQKAPIEAYLRRFSCADSAQINQKNRTYEVH